MGIGELKDFMASMGELPEDSPAVKAGKQFVNVLLADAAAGGLVGTALKAALNAARDPRDAVYGRLNVVERTMAVTLVGTIAKSLEA